MFLRCLICALALLVSVGGLRAQEISCKIDLNSQKATTVPQSVFKTLQGQINEYMNQRVWTEDLFENNERINVNMTLVIEEELTPTTFRANLIIQSSRPTFGSNYTTALFEHVDKDIVIEYEEFQPIEFSENVFNDNLGSILAFYSYFIIGLDYDSFSELGGTRYFEKAQQIINNVPPNLAGKYPGWVSTENSRNRYWLAENMLSPRMRSFRKAMYTYHLDGLDLMAEDTERAKANMMTALNSIEKSNREYPNTIMMVVFINSKAAELVEVFKPSARAQRSRVYDILVRLNPANASKYRILRS